MSELTEYVIMPGSDYQNICNSVRSKIGGTDVLKSGEVSAAIDSIQASGGGIEHKDVNFYDYDGTLLHSYTVEEASSLTSLPTLPSHDRLICQGWNYDLDTIKKYGRSVDIGAMYITDDGKTRLYIDTGSGVVTDVTINYGYTGTNGVTIDWGDGTSETATDVGYVTKTHTYENTGDYIISLDSSENITLGYNDSDSCMHLNNFNLARLKKVEIGSNVKILNSCSFQYCYALSNISIPNGVTSIGNNAFSNCYALSNISIPNGVTSIGFNAFSSCYVLSNISIPNGVTSIGFNAFSNCYALSNISIPNGVTSIGNNAFGGSGTNLYDFSSHTSVPTLGSNVFISVPSGFEIRVPAALYDEWVAATNWSTYASNIVAV